MIMDVADFLTILLYVFGITLLVALTVFVIHLIETLKKVNVLLDDLTSKSEKLNGVFDIVDRSSGAINSVVGNVGGKISGIVSSVLRKKKGSDEEDE